MRSKMYSSLVALASLEGWMMAKIIWEAALSHSFLVVAICRASVTPQNTTSRVDGRCLNAPPPLLSMPSAMVRNANSRSSA